jgi:KaiC/GvpD/RAD55 family RecA-like ATPase
MSGDVIMDAHVLDFTPTSIGGIQVQRVRDIKPHFNMLVYGKSGVGKTTLAGSAQAVPEMQRVLIVDIEGGVLSLRREFPDVDVVRVQSWREMQQVYDHLYAGGHGYRTVVLDSLTEIQKFNMDDIMRKLVEQKDARDEDVPSLREWGKNLEQIRRFVRAFRDLPLNVIFTALVREDKDSMLRPINVPSLSGKMAGEVAAFLDIVLFYSVKEVTDADNNKKQVRVLQSQATETTTAKDRSGLLPPALVNPTMEELYDIIIRRTGKMMETKAKAAVQAAPRAVAPKAPAAKPQEKVTDETIQLLTGETSAT